MLAGEALTIREATPADLAAMLDLWVEAWNRARPETDFEARRGWFTRHLDALTDGGARVFVVVIEGDRVAGFVTLNSVSGEVDQLATAIWAQRRGLGRRLLRHVKSISPRGLVLTVNQFNKVAIRLYEHEGFEKVGEGVSAGLGLPVWNMRWNGPGRTDAIVGSPE